MGVSNVGKDLRKNLLAAKTFKHDVRCSVCSCRVSHVLLEPTVLPGVLQRHRHGQLGYLRHAGANRWLVGRLRVGVQGGRRPLRLETHRGGVRRRNHHGLLVRDEAHGRNLHQQRKLHVHVAQTRF